MKAKSSALAVTLWCAASAHAATLTWDADPGTPGAQDGAGAWDDVSTTWFDGVANTNWTDANPDSAVIGAGSGAAGTITVTAARVIGGLAFEAAASGTYTVSGGSLVLSNNPTITANANATIGSVLAGAGVGFTKAGPGALTLTGINTYSGGTTIGAGILQLGTPAANGTIIGSYAIAAGATLQLDYARLSSARGPTSPARARWRCAPPSRLMGRPTGDRTPRRPRASRPVLWARCAWTTDGTTRRRPDSVA
jgi:autotransporter-associated beta strand protein